MSWPRRLSSVVVHFTSGPGPWAAIGAEDRCRVEEVAVPIRTKFVRAGGWGPGVVLERHNDRVFPGTCRGPGEDSLQRLVVWGGPTETDPRWPNDQEARRFALVGVRCTDSGLAFEPGNVAALPPGVDI